MLTEAVFRFPHCLVHATDRFASPLMWPMRLAAIVSILAAGACRDAAVAGYLSTPAPTIPPSHADEFTPLNGATYFIAEDSAHGTELWRSRGTVGTTRMVLDLNPGQADGIIRSGLTAFRGHLYFTARTSDDGCGLWRSDGTAPGTTLVRQFAPNEACRDGVVDPRILTVFDDLLLIAAPEHGTQPALWASDGTTTGTRVIHSLESDANREGAHSYFLADLGDSMLFASVSANRFASSDEVWRTDGTTEGTFRIIATGGTNLSGGFQHGLAALDGIALFLQFGFFHPPQLWRTDGTEAGTFKISDYILDASFGCTDADPPVGVCRGTAYFVAQPEGQTGSALWRTDGTVGGTEPIFSEFPAGGSPGCVREWLAGDAALLFTVPTAGGSRLWRSDGTAEGTLPVFGCALGSTDCPREIQRLASFADEIVFAASDPRHGCGAWVSDGTEGGTRRLAGSDAVRKTCDDLDRRGARGPRNFTAVGRSLYFLHDDGVHGFEPWISDGTPPGTRLLADINTGVVPCTGDCNEDGTVTVPELIRAVNIALGAASLRACPAADQGADERVSVPEVVSAVRNAIDSCGPTPEGT